MPRGGRRENSGRKSKTDEEKLLQKLSPFAPAAFKALETGLKEKNPFYVKLWFEYYYGKPKQTIDQNNTGDLTVTTIQVVRERSNGNTKEPA